MTSYWIADIKTGIIIAGDIGDFEQAKELQKKMNSISEKEFGLSEVLES